MPVDAYPDLSPPMVEIITQWPGHAAEEMERLVTLPLEVEMNGVPQLVVMRSITLYGLSDILLTFTDDTDNYFARQNVFPALGQMPSFPPGVTPTLAPLFSPERTGLPLCAGEPRSQPAGTENDRGLGHRARLQVREWRGRRFWLRRHVLCSIRFCSILRGSTGIT